MDQTLELPLHWTTPRPSPPLAPPRRPLAEELIHFRDFGRETRRLSVTYSDASQKTRELPVFVNEFWTAKQRQANSLHEISYRACFKPQLPRFFIERLTRPGDSVYDPFMGRGTTLLEAALLGRVPVGNDVNPLSVFMALPRLKPPSLDEIAERLARIPLDTGEEAPPDLLVFYHPETLRAIASLKRYLVERRRTGAADAVDAWIQMVALNRLTGHSNGFFSVYTLPPNQAVSVKSQRKINEQRRQTPPPRDVRAILLKKSRQLLGDCSPAVRQALDAVASRALLLTGSATSTPAIPDRSIELAVTSPPFLNIVDYATDNWLRCWFADLDHLAVKLTVPRKLEHWQAAMTEVFRELHRVLKSGGHVAFEVGEVHRGKTKLDEAVLPCGACAGLEPVLILINDQQFTKTANCWGVDNNSKGTNTNRVVVFQKP